MLCYTHKFRLIGNDSGGTFKEKLWILDRDLQLCRFASSLNASGGQNMLGSTCYVSFLCFTSCTAYISLD